MDANPFEKIADNHEVPIHLKEKVMKNVQISTFMMEVATLFSTYYVSSVSSLFSSKTSKNNLK